MVSSMATPVAGSMDGVTIFSGKAIDDATQQAIRSMLQSAGHDGDIRFVDHESIAGQVHGITMIDRSEVVED